jgi:hypothetical protein
MSHDQDHDPKPAGYKIKGEGSIVPPDHDPKSAGYVKDGEGTATSGVVPVTNPVTVPVDHDPKPAGY